MVMYRRHNKLCTFAELHAMCCTERTVNEDGYEKTWLPHTIINF